MQVLTQSAKEVILLALMASCVSYATVTEALSSESAPSMQSSFAATNASIEHSRDPFDFRRAAIYNNDRAMVTFICGVDQYWDFLDNILFSQSSWKTESTMSVYLCNEHHMNLCQQRKAAYSLLHCKRQSITDLPQINAFKAASILEAITVETAKHLLFIDVDMAFKRDVWVDLRPYMLFDLAFSNQGGYDTVSDINIGAVLVKRSRKTFEFWKKVYERILSTGSWDQKVVSDLAWEHAAGVTFALFPISTFYAFGFGYPIKNADNTFDSAAALHAVCMTGKWLLLKEVGFWNDVNGYYTNSSLIRLDVASQKLDAQQLSAFLAASIRVATKCTRKVILPDNVRLDGQSPVRFYELWDARRLGEMLAPVVEPSFDLHASRLHEAQVAQGNPPRLADHTSNFVMDENFVVNPPCSDTSRFWRVTADSDMLSYLPRTPVDGSTINDATPLLYFCASAETRQRVPCQVRESNFTYCDHGDVTFSYPL